MLIPKLAELLYPDYYVIVIIDKYQYISNHIVTEGNWKPSSEKGYWMRVDKPSNDSQKLHIHIARDKHIKSKKNQVSWNSDGTRHDIKSFNQNFHGIEKAKSIAHKVLGISKTLLEHVANRRGENIILESISSTTSDIEVIILELK